MKITDFKKEDLEKGIKIRRKGWRKDISISFNKSASIFDAYINGIITGDKTDLTLEDITSDDWELIEKPTQVWRPKEGDSYFYITETGRVISSTFLSFLPSDNAKVLFKNVFQTREEAEHMLEKIKIINKLRELSNINFKDTCGAPHYAIAYHDDTHKITYSADYYYRESPFNLYFATVEDCKKAIEIIGEDNLKKYYFDIKDLEMTKQLLERMHFSYEITNWKACIAMTIYDSDTLIDITTYECTLLFNFDGSYRGTL